ncbi:hypothetical protein HY449_03725 [Candidatus Pacearchaeota archaeon]|nr:hypothetical protein [Candidatus Pacearchaeota archaeon]
MSKTLNKFMFQPRTFDEKTVKDSLEAVSILNGKEPYYLVGGMATQGYLPSSCRRPTSDLDFSIARPLTYADFKQMAKPLDEFLRDSGYDTLFVKGSRAFGLYLNPEDKSSGIVLEFARRSGNDFERKQKTLEREYSNSRKKIIEERDGTYRSACPEDIAVPKLVRAVSYLNRNPEFSKLLPERLRSMSTNEVRVILSNINSLRAQVSKDIEDSKRVQMLKFVSDAYDLRILAEIVGFNDDYFEEAEEDWFKVGDKDLRDMVARATLPQS